MKLSTTPEAVSNNVHGTVSRSVSLTGRPDMYEVPRSPRRASDAHRQYRTGSGSSSPISARSSATAAGDAGRPPDLASRTDAAGSPGAASSSPKHTIDRATTTSIAVAARVTSRRAI